MKKENIKEDLDNLAFSQIKEQPKVDTSKLYKLKAKGQKFAEKKYKKKLEPKDGIVNLESCYQACAGLKSEVCDSFAFCRRQECFLLDCFLGAVNSQTVPDEDDGKPFEADWQCDLYTISSLRYFKKHENRRLVKDEKDLLLRSYGDSNSAKCAQNCLNFNMERSRIGEDWLLATWIHRARLIGAPKNDLPLKKEDQILNRISVKGFQRKSVVGLVFLFMFVGIAVGIGGFYGHRKYLNPDPEYEEMMFRFSTLRNPDLFKRF